MENKGIKAGQKWQSKADQKIAIIVAVYRHEVTYMRDGSDRKFDTSKATFKSLYAPTFATA